MFIRLNRGTDLLIRIVTIGIILDMIVIGMFSLTYADEITIENDLYTAAENNAEIPLRDKILELYKGFNSFDESRVSEEEEHNINEGAALESFSEDSEFLPEDETEEVLFAQNAPAGAGPAEMKGNRDFIWPVPSAHGLSSCFKDGRNHDARE